MNCSLKSSERRVLALARVLVVKLGTGVLSRPDGGLDASRIRGIAAQVKFLRRSGRRVVLVSSGAISAGMARLGLRRRPARIADLQACAAVGQNLLMAGYERAFRRLGFTVAQILLTHEDLRHSERRKNAGHTLTRLLERGVVPIINENDAVSFAEIKFGDNDQLASMVHELVRSHVCILLSHVNGFLIREKSGEAQVLPTIRHITAEMERQAGGSGSQRSVGGMRSKILAARRVMATGKPMIIANGRSPRILSRLMSGEVVGTLFLP